MTVAAVLENMFLIKSPLKTEVSSMREMLQKTQAILNSQNI